MKEDHKISQDDVTPLLDLFARKSFLPLDSGPDGPWPYIQCEWVLSNRAVIG